MPDCVQQDSNHIDEQRLVQQTIRKFVDRQDRNSEPVIE